MSSMSLGHVWIVGVGTVLSFGLVVVAVYLLRGYRKQLLPPGERRDRGEALAELHVLQARMRKKLEDGGGFAQASGSARGHPDPSHGRAAVSDAQTAPPQGRMTPPPAKLEDEESRAEALSQLQALQAKMRKKLEEDQARERASGLDMGSPDPGVDDHDSEL
jgi:hypothetical protein